VVVYTCNPSTREAEKGGWRVQSQPELHNKTVSTITKYLSASTYQITITTRM
jgi:hypothetical protein